MKTEFKPVAMPCNKEQFEEMRPTLEKGGLEIYKIESFDEYPCITNNYNGSKKRVSNINLEMCADYKRTLIPYNPNEFYKACGIELPKYDLSKLNQDHIQELIKEPNIHEMFVRIGVVKNQLEVGKYYKCNENENLLCFYSGNNQGNNYGFGYNNIFAKGIYFNETNTYYEATPEEVTKRLIEYAKSIGFAKGVKVISVDEQKERVIDDYDAEYIEFEIDYPNSLNFGNITVYKDGIWATIIPQEETYIKIPLSEIKATPNYYELGRLVKNIADNY